VVIGVVAVKGDNIKTLFNTEFSKVGTNETSGTGD
jgi:hypothetical protein